MIVPVLKTILPGIYLHVVAAKIGAICNNMTVFNNSVTAYYHKLKDKIILLPIFCSFFF